MSDNKQNPKATADKDNNGEKSGTDRKVDPNFKRQEDGNKNEGVKSDAERKGEKSMRSNESEKDEVSQREEVR
ncbi:MAG: hypothetical protein ABW189_05250 [Rickettsiales bacterium]